MNGAHPCFRRNQGRAHSRRALRLFPTGIALASFVGAGIGIAAFGIGIAAAAATSPWPAISVIVPESQEEPPRYVPPEELSRLAAESGDHAPLGLIYGRGRSVPAGLSWEFIGPK